MTERCCWQTRCAIGLAISLVACGGDAEVPGTGGTGHGGAGHGGGGATGTGSGGAGDECGPGECLLVSPLCCTKCEPHLPTSAPVHETELEAFNQQKSSQCAAVDCQDCDDPVLSELSNLAAICRDGACAAIDVRQDLVSECRVDADCHLRWGTACCQCGSGDPQTLVAVVADFDSWVCKADGCLDKCAPPEIPANAHAACVAGHCTVEFLEWSRRTNLQEEGKTAAQNKTLFLVFRLPFFRPISTPPSVILVESSSTGFIRCPADRAMPPDRVRSESELHENEVAVSGAHQRWAAVERHGRLEITEHEHARVGECDTLRIVAIGNPNPTTSSRSSMESSFTTTPSFFPTDSIGPPPESMGERELRGDENVRLGDRSEPERPAMFARAALAT